MITTIFGCTYTEDRNEAFKYRFVDRSPNWGSKKSGVMYTKYVKLYYYDKSTKTYRLPPIAWDHKLKTTFGFTYTIEVNPIMKLWEGQQKAVDFCRDFFDKGGTSVLIDSQVGTGKSIIMLGLINEFKCRTLITVPSVAIGLGIQEKLQPYCDVKFMDGEAIRKADKLPDVLVCHRQSAVNCWYIINGNYDLMINDEQHHLSDGMKMMCNTWRGRGVIGLTGTPFRKEMNKQDFLLYFQTIYETGLQSLPVRVLTHKYRHTYTMADYLKASEGLDPESPEVLRRLVNANDEKIFDLKNVVTKLYHKCNMKRLMVFVDRREYQERIKELVFPNAILINGDIDKEKVLAELKTKDTYLIIGMVTASGEGFDVPGVQCGILFFSTSWEGSIIQMVGRAKRFAEGKEHAYWLDFQEISKIEPDQYKSFGMRERLRMYDEQGWPVMPLDDYIKSLSDNTRLFNS